MQLKNQEADLSGDLLIPESQIAANYSDSAPEAKIDTPSPQPKKKSIKLALLIGLPISFVVGLGAILFLLPTKLGCGNKAMQAEGRNNIGAMNRGQQAYFLENNKFASSIPELAIGINTQTVNYQYFVQADRQFSVSYAQSKKQNFKSYLGVAFVGIVPNSDRTLTTQSIICEVNQPQPLANIMPIYQNGTVSCPQGTKQLGY